MSNNLTSMKSKYSNNYETISQYYRMDNTTNQNPPYGVATFYQLGPQPYSLCPRTSHGFHSSPYDQYQNYLNSLFQGYKSSNEPNKYGIYYQN